MLFVPFLHLILVLVLSFVSAETNKQTEPKMTPPPLPAPKDLNHLLLWGTYKPHLISAITQKSLQPITVGFAFSDFMTAIPSESDFKNSLRFRVRRNMPTQYSHHNGLDLAIEKVTDTELGISYDIAFIEDTLAKSQSDPSPLATEWIYVIEASKLEEHSRDPAAEKDLNTFVYLSLGDLEGRNEDMSYIQVVDESEKSSIVLEIKDAKNNLSKGFFRISAFDETNQNIREIINCASVDVNKTDTWKVEDIIRRHLTENEFEDIAYLDPARSQTESKDSINIFLQQVIAKPNFKIVIAFNPWSVPKVSDMMEVKSKIQQRKRSFEEEFDKKFPISNVNKFLTNVTEASEISRYALSNLLGGILYSYGKVRVNQRDNQEPPSAELFTATPSRVGFPRGFLWDEGFHESVICEWNTSLCIQMMKSWFNSIQEDGWIPREQARGDELESNFMQKDFLYQSQQEANPPSMILPITKLQLKLSKLELGDPDGVEIYEFLGWVLPRLKQWFSWLVKTQLNSNPLDGGNSALLLKWMCKPPCNGKYFASGFDDYPRHPASGYHAIAQLDLHVWIATFLQGVLRIQGLFKQDTQEIEKFYHSILGSLEFFYDAADNIPKDIIGTPGPKGEPNQRFRLVNLGYVNLFPLYFGYETSPDRLDAIINLITSRDHLWSDFGIRSLSKSDPFFQKGDNYWTEPIWIPMNYLLLRSLKTTYYNRQNARELYEALRENLIENFSASWKTTHNFWENYDSFNGAGKGFPSFTGWTSVITLIYSEKFE